MFDELTNNPMFGLVLTMIIYLVSVEICKKIRLPFMNPLVIATALIIFILVVLKIPYENYYNGGQILNILITPATVALAIPLYKTFHLLKKHVRSIMTGILLGSLLGTFLTGILAVFMNLNHDLTVSIMPKSVTTAIAIGISEKMAGNPTVTLVTVIITGIIGSIIGPMILKLCRITDPVAQGIALGSSAHAIGTTKAIELGRVQGAMSGLAIGVTGLVTVFVAPLMMKLLDKFFF